MEFEETARLQRDRFRGGATGIRNSGDSMVRDLLECTNAIALSMIFSATAPSDEECGKHDVSAHTEGDLLLCNRSLLTGSCCFIEKTEVRGVEVVEGKNDADNSKLCRLAAFPTRPKSADNRCLRPKCVSTSNKNQTST